jgi:hypothetical protein
VAAVPGGYCQAGAGQPLHHSPTVMEVSQLLASQWRRAISVPCRPAATRAVQSGPWKR